MTPAQIRLLLIEDDESLRSIRREILARAGFEVETASRATEAIDLPPAGMTPSSPTATSRTSFRSTGWQPCAEWRRPRPSSSSRAYLASPTRSAFRRSFAPFAVLEKPFPVEQLVTAVRRAIEHNDPASANTSR